ncbi:MAG: PAC2 family protein [Candidatus Bathyarchaeia archaeon]
MKRTIIIEIEKVDAKNPILIEGLPGLGMVGRIAVKYLIKHLKARKIAELYSPHFAYYVIVDSDNGSVTLLKNEFYYWKNEYGNHDLILLTGDSQAQTIDGQYEVAETILKYAKKKNVKLIITIGGYRKEVVGTPSVFASATDLEVLKRALEAGSVSSPAGNPIVGIAGLLLGLAKLKGISGACLLSETPGYMPDPRAAKSALTIISRMLDLRLDLTDLDREISKIAQLEEELRKMEEQRKATEEEVLRRERGAFYIG